MKSNYTFEVKDTHLEMRIWGPYDYWEFIEYPGMIRDRCEAEGKSRISVDMIGVTYEELPTLEMFFLGEKLAEKLRGRVKIALVWHASTRDHFLQNVAANRATCISTFNTVPKANSWLLSDLEDQPYNFHHKDRV
jgi:hypothetical protein